METPGNKTVTDTIIEGLKRAVVEIEELRVQVSLGKAEAKDLYENVKRSFNAKLHEAKMRLKSLKTNADVLPLVNAFEHLQVQLALGIAESKDTFEVQRKKIEQALGKLEATIEGHKTHDETYAGLHLEIEKFKT